MLNYQPGKLNKCNTFTVEPLNLEIEGKEAFETRIYNICLQVRKMLE